MTLRRRAIAALRKLQGTPTGYIDQLDVDRVAGWAVDPASPDQPARLSLHVDGAHVMNILADMPREDVLAAGLGPLHSGFDAALPVRLRDGQPHVVELRAAASGRLLRGGRLRLTPDSIASFGTSPGAGQIEGVVYLDRGTQALTGWANGVGSIRIAFDGGAPQDYLLDREVPGLGGGNRQGFRLPLPATLTDGAWHEAQILAGDVELDGSPLQFRLQPDQPRVAIDSLIGHRLNLRLRGPSGAPLDTPVTVLADGTPLPLAPSENEPGHLSVLLPETARHIVVTTSDPAAEESPSATDPGTVLARFLLTPDAPAGLAQFLVRPDASILDEPRLPDDLVANARRAFATFLDTPDWRFDPIWYASSHNISGGTDAALTHWRDSGAALGLSPGPRFDEAAARALYPAIRHALKAQGLPCAFALELVLGEGALNSLTGVADPTERALPHLDPATVPEPKLPPHSFWRAPQDSIYSAWLTRLDLADAERGELILDETRMRHEVESQKLRRQPLVSIIMPSWNRAFTIGEAVQSVLEQSYPNWELLICDDASEDRTSDVVRGFGDPRIRYMRFIKSNGAGARNHGLRFARGEYIAYLDSDNIWHPLFLDRMLRALMGEPGKSIAYSAYLDTEIEGAKVALQAVSRPPFRPLQLSNKNFMDLNSIVHHRRVSDWLGGFDDNLPRLQDWDMMLRHTAVFPPTFINRVGVFYRRNIAWGQVTHTQIASGAQDTVNEKTRRRIAGQVERLDLSWPAEGRCVVLSAARPGAGEKIGLPDALLAERLADMAADFGRVDLVTIGAPPQALPDAPKRPSLTRHALPAALLEDPGRLSHVLGGLLGRAPLLATGMTPTLMRQMPDVVPAQSWLLQNHDTSSVLQSLDARQIRFDLGALPLRLPEATDQSPQQHPELLVLSPATTGSWEIASRLPMLQEQAAERGLTLLLPPSGTGPWRRLDGEQVTDVDGALPEALTQVRLSVVMGPVSQLTPFGLSLLTGLQARGIPAALPTEPELGGSLAGQWLDARAAYELKTPSADWVFEKLGKLIADRAALERFSERSLTTHAIAFHPALVRERLAQSLWRMQFDTPKTEVIDNG